MKPRSEELTSFLRYWQEDVEDEAERTPGLPRGVATTTIVCPNCGGRGKTWHGDYSHNAISYSQDEWAELGPDTQDDYMLGRYDQTCPECKGNNVVEELDRDHTETAILAEWDEWMDAAYESAAIERQDRMMGA